MSEIRDDFKNLITKIDDFKDFQFRIDMLECELSDLLETYDRFKLAYKKQQDELKQVSSHYEALDVDFNRRINNYKNLIAYEKKSQKKES